MYGQNITVGQKVSVGKWINGTYAGATAAVVVEILGDCDLRTQGHVIVRDHSGKARQVHAVKVHPHPAKADRS